MNIAQAFKDKYNLSRHLKENFEKCRKISDDIANVKDTTELNAKLKELKSVAQAQLEAINNTGVQ